MRCPKCNGPANSKDVRRWKCKVCKSVFLKSAHPRPKRERAIPATRLPSSAVYIVTWAQNATPVHKGFWEALLALQCEYNAQLVVIPGRYRNPTVAGEEHEEWWDDNLTVHLYEGRKLLGKHLQVHGDVPIQPTAVTPLSGFEVFAGEYSALFGHPKLQLQTVASADRYKPRLLTTTGACTVPNYSASKAGRKAQAHHVLGAVIVEITDKGLFHLRHVNAAKDGSFIDLGTHYKTDATPAPPAEALVLGDLHAEQVDEAALAASIEQVHAVQAKRIVLHDVLDFRARNHHNNTWHLHSGPQDVEEELWNTANVITELAEHADEVLIVQSNHDEALDRWLLEADPKRDPQNALLYHQLWYELLQQHPRPPAFEHWCKGKLPDNVKFLRRNSNYSVKGIALSFHGDKGINGARGSINQYAKLGTKSVIGHSHCPGIRDGAYQVGVIGKLDQGYNHTPSSWLHSNCVVYSNGKRALLNIVEGKWRNEP